MDPDVIVLGAGLAGLAAAATVTECGGRPLVLERAPSVGGSAALSSGYLWSTPDLAALRREDSGRFQLHGHLVVDGYASAHEWLTRFAEPLTETQQVLAGRGRRFDMPLALAAIVRALYARGGVVMVNACVTDIEKASGLFVVSVATPDDQTTVSSGALVLATGGRQGSAAIRRSLANGGGLMPLRANPYSRGEGADLARSLGAEINEENRGFYGHLFAARLEPVSPAEFSLFALFHSEDGVLLDRGGRRFADETQGDHKLAAAVAAHGGTGLLLWSEEVQRVAAGPPSLPGDPQVDRWAIAKDRGGRVTSAVGLADLASAVRRWGFDVEPGDLAAFGRLGHGRLFAAEVVPAITYTFGGVKVDGAGLVVGRVGAAIPGLFVAGADMSDIYHEGYGGGLCAAIVTGRRAGRLAATAALEQRKRVT